MENLIEYKKSLLEELKLAFANRQYDSSLGWFVENKINQLELEIENQNSKKHI